MRHVYDLPVGSVRYAGESPALNDGEENGRHQVGMRQHALPMLMAVAADIGRHAEFGGLRENWPI